MVSSQKINQMKKMVRTYLGVLDFDRLFCSSVTAVEFNENSEKNNFSKKRENKFI